MVPRPLRWTHAAFVLVGFLGAYVLANRAVMTVCTCEAQPLWPVSIIHARWPTPIELAWGLLVLVLFVVGMRALARRRFPLWAVVLFGTALVLGTTFMHGWQGGIVHAIDGLTDNHGRQEYYHDALEVTRPLDFLGDYVDLQPSLRLHSQTHPPGAVLIFYLFDRIIPNPAGIALLIGALSALTALFLSGIIGTVTGDRRRERWIALLWFLLPAAQVYNLATLDALICVCITGCVYFFLQPPTMRSFAAWIALLFVASTLTFAFTFVLPILAFLAWQRRQKADLIGGLSIVASAYLALNVGLGFNYLASLRTATRIENPTGPLWLVDPVRYGLTRIEGITEFALFAGPLVLLAVAGALWSLGRPHDLRVWAREHLLAAMALVAVGTWLAMLATGAFRVGETGRACQFLYPFLLLPLAEPRARLIVDRRVLLSGTFALAWGMQLVGDYLW